MQKYENQFLSKMASSSRGYEMIKGPDSIDQIVLRNSGGASATVSLCGAQVISWKNNTGEELLFTSMKNNFWDPLAVEGGICICYPVFRKGGQTESYVKDKIWSIEDDPPPLDSKYSDNSSSLVDLLLIHISPSRIELRLRVGLGRDGNLSLISRVRNLGGKKPHKFTFGYHTHFLLADITDIRVEGLESQDFLDNLRPGKRFTASDALTFDSQVDRVYLDCRRPILIVDYDRKRTCVVNKIGLPDIAVWNPWDGARDYTRMVCIDASAVEEEIMLQNREEWTGKVKLEFYPKVPPFSIYK